MSEKVKVTQEQAEAIEMTRENNHYDTVLTYILQNKRIPNERFRVLSEMTLEDLVKALILNEYEIEPQFKVGDLVVYIHDSTIWQVIGELYGGKVHYEITRNGTTIGSIHKDHIRLATPEEIKAEKERQLWKSIDREVGHFKPDDIGISKDNNTHYRNKPGMLEHLYRSGNLKGFYPVESYVKF